MPPQGASHLLHAAGALSRQKGRVDNFVEQGRVLSATEQAEVMAGA